MKVRCYVSKEVWNSLNTVGTVIPKNIDFNESIYKVLKDSSGFQNIFFGMSLENCEWDDECLNLVDMKGHPLNEICLELEIPKEETFVGNFYIFDDFLRTARNLKIPDLSPEHKAYIKNKYNSLKNAIENQVVDPNNETTQVVFPILKDSYITNIHFDARAY